MIRKEKIKSISNLYFLTSSRRWVESAKIAEKILTIKQLMTSFGLVKVTVTILNFRGQKLINPPHLFYQN